MPNEIQESLSRVIDATSTSAIAIVTNKVEALRTKITQSLENAQKITIEAVHTNTYEGRSATTRLANNFEALANSQERSAKSTAELHAELRNVSIAQSTSTDLVLRDVRQCSDNTRQAMHRQISETRTHLSSLHKKLDEVDTSIGVLHGSLRDMSRLHLSISDKSEVGVEEAIRNTLSCVYLLLLNLQLLVRELLYVLNLANCSPTDRFRMLLAPYLIAFCRSTLPRFLLCGDRFLFEDAVGRKKWLPCTQFQYWEVGIKSPHLIIENNNEDIQIFYEFLSTSFRNTPGLKLVLAQSFLVQNGYNGHPITQHTWRAVIQPKSKIIMSMLLEYQAIRQGRCADPLCSGRISFIDEDTTRIW
jgi:hypothetical protein